MPKKNAPAKKRSKVAVKDLATKANPKGGLTLTTAPNLLTVKTAIQSALPTLNAKGTDVSMESLVLATERFEPE